MNKIFLLFLFLSFPLFAEDTQVDVGVYTASTPAALACRAAYGTGANCSYSAAGPSMFYTVAVEDSSGNTYKYVNSCAQINYNGAYSSCTENHYTWSADGSCPSGTADDGSGYCSAPTLSCPEAGTVASYQHSPGGFLATVGGCFTTDNGPASCTGGSQEDGGYCVTEVTFSGEADPQQTVNDGFENIWTGEPDPKITGDGTQGTNTSDSESADTSSTSTVDNGDGSTTTTTTTTNSSSSGNPDGSTTSQTGSTTTSTTQNADGSSTTTTTSTGTEETEGQGYGSASGNCDLPPVCFGGDPQLCAILRQNWETTCATSGNGTGVASGDCEVPPACEDGDPQLCAILNQQFLSSCSGDQVDIDTFTGDLASSGLESADDLDTILTDEEEDLSSDLDAAIAEGLGGSVSGGSCPFVDIPLLYGVSIEATKLCAVFDIMKALVAMLAYIFAAFIMFEAVRL